MNLPTCILAALLTTAAWPSSASVALLVGEPFGKFGYFNPTGHAAVYLSGVCAETPVRLRPCRPGEPGVVISRYNRIAGLDWIAIPLLPYLYAVERPEDVPAIADGGMVARLRDNYRRAYLQDLVPDGPDGETPKGDWIQLIGAAYDRNIYGFALDTTPEDDARLIEHFNTRPNQRRFNLFYRNCADFARQIVNFYHPRSVGRNIIGDLGITTPKHAAKTLVKYSQRQPGVELVAFLVPQIEGGRPSTRLRGVNESLIRSKKYVAPLIIFQPWVAASAAAAYLTSGRFNPGRLSQAQCGPDNLAACVAGMDLPAASRALRPTGQAEVTQTAPSNHDASHGGAGGEPQDGPTEHREESCCLE